MRGQYLATGRLSLRTVFITHGCTLTCPLDRMICGILSRLPTVDVGMRALNCEDT